MSRSAGAGQAVQAGLSFDDWFDALAGLAENMICEE
jgi:hypothetical protein